MSDASPSHDRTRPIRVAIVNDYEIVVRGLQAMLEPFRDRIEVVALEVDDEPDEPADIALFDTFGGRRSVLERSAKMVDEHIVEHVVLYTWDAAPQFVAEADRIGVSGLVLKSSSADGLVEAMERVVEGERVGLDPGRRRTQSDAEGLSPREQEVLALVAQGLTNREIAAELYLSVDTVKTYVRRLFTKLGVDNRTRAAAHVHRLGLVPQQPDEDRRP